MTIGFSADTARAAGGGIAIGPCDMPCGARRSIRLHMFSDPNRQCEPAQSRYGYPLSLELTSQ